MGRTDLSDKFQKMIIRHQHIGYDLNFMRKSAGLVINLISVDNFSALFHLMAVDRASDYKGPDLKLFILVRWDRRSFVCCLVHWGSTDDHFLLQIPSGVVWQTRDLYLSRDTLFLLSPRLAFIVLKRDLFVYHNDSLTS